MSKKFGVSQSFIEAMKAVHGIKSEPLVEEAVYESTAKPGSFDHMVKVVSDYNDASHKEHESYLNRNYSSKKWKDNHAKHGNNLKKTHDTFIKHYGHLIPKEARADFSLGHYNTKNPTAFAHHWHPEGKKYKPVNENVVEEEQIDELKSSTLRSYISKVKDKIDDLEDEGDYQNHFGDSEYARKHTFAKAGQHRASKSLANMKIRRREDEAEHAEWEAKKAREKVTEDAEYDYTFVDEFGRIVEALDMNEDFVELMFAEGVERISTEDILAEDIEDLEELNKDTLRAYTKGAEASVAATKKKGKPSKAVVALRTKRGKGLENAKAKLQAIIKKESDAHMAQVAAIHTDHDKHFEDNHHDILAKHGFKLLAKGEEEDKHIKTYAHAHSNGGVTMVSIHSKKNHDPVKNFGYKHEVKATNSHGTSWSSHYPNTGSWHTDEDKVASHKAQILPKFENHIIDVKNTGEKGSRW